ncbi:phosphotransferase family protein [Streptomyces sp. NPDC102467]|uniref:phosphotransferase family protein n=1 Tax=Streptomyces sp. NPDC102467 TaxID=3366179 RepID=UPI00380427C9
MTLPLSPPVLRTLAAAAVIPEDIQESAPLTGGTYNTLVRVVLRDRRRWVVKLPPPATGGTTLTYEHDLLRAESVYYDAASRVDGVPMPRVVHTQLDGDPATVTGLVMTERPGVPWQQTGQDLQTHERGLLRAELGGHVARLHTLTGPAFGYPARPFGPPPATWRQAFTEMTDAVLDDAERFHAQLPRPVGTVRTILASAADVLDDVTRPAVVHFDLWEGNLLLDGPPGHRSLSGIIDGERMFFGDPVAEFVSLALFGDIEEDEAFLTGYAAAGGRAPFTDSMRLRYQLYRAYLYLIMLVETVPRRYGPERRAWAWTHAGKELTVALDAVTAATTL